LIPIAEAVFERCCGILGDVNAKCILACVRVGGCVSRLCLPAPQSHQLYSFLTLSWLSQRNCCKMRSMLYVCVICLVTDLRKVNLLDGLKCLVMQSIS